MSERLDGDSSELLSPRPKSGRSRPRARLVCSACRQRKIKCNAEKITPGQVCAPCQASSSQCIINWNNDRRRKAANQRVDMQERINFLEAMIIANTQSHTREDSQSSQPDTSAQHITSLSPICPPSGASPARSLVPSSTRALAIALDTSNEVVQPELQITQIPGHWNQGASHLSPPQRAMTERREARAPSTIPQFLAQQPDLEARRDVAPSKDPAVLCAVGLPTPTTLSESDPWQFGAKEDGGELRYFGTTSNTHIQSLIEEHQASNNEEELDPDCTLSPESTQVQKALTDTFFKVQPHSGLLVVEEEPYRVHRARGQRCRYYSTFLENAIFAYASRYSTSSAVRALGKQYAERAKTHISFELEQPEFATLQGFILLSDFECTRCRARVGWTYSVIATGLMVDLGLHVNSPDSDKDRRMTPKESKYRDNLLLATFVCSTLWNKCLGRPISFPSTVLAAVGRVASTIAEVGTLHVWTSLCTQMFEILDVLNNPSLISSSNPAALPRMWELDPVLRSFINTIPTHLALDDSRIEDLDPNVYGVHMQWSGIQITLHLAMIKLEHMSQGTNAADHRQVPRVTDDLFATVSENVVRIARLVLSYKRVFGIEAMVTIMLDNIFVAAIAQVSLILRAQRRGLSTEADIAWLRLFIDTLELVGKHYPVTLLMRSSLTSLMAKTTLSALFPRRALPQGKKTCENMSVVEESIASADADMNGSGLAVAYPDLYGLDFTLTDEDSAWIHDVGWNMASGSTDSTDDILSGADRSSWNG